MLLSPNLVIADRYRLERQIGRGGMGSVWLARHLGLDIPCAVKFIEGEYAALPEAQARFVREAKAAAQLRSPHVVQILDHGVWQGTPYMAMELLEGEDLGKRLTRVGRMAAQDVCVIITQVSRALTKAHGAGIVHRDLKPDNIYLVHDDDREIAKVLDFGIAKAQGAIDGSNTKTGAMLGTPYYMSPEQAQGVKAVDHRSDLWSLAVIVYQALTGKLPFESEALGDLLVKIIVQPIPMPSQVAPDLPAAFDRWWAKAASRDPAQRYQSARELSDGLSLVFGQSQLTDVMDRSELRAAMGDGGVRRSSGGNPVVTPNPLMTPAPGTSPAAATMPFTPQPYATPQPGGGPMQPPFGASPPPYAQTPQPQVTTGAPIARTFDGSAALPKSRAGLFVGIAAGGVLLCALLVGAVFALKGKHADTAAAAAGSATGSAVAAVAPPLASATLDPIPSASAAPDSSGSAAPPADSSAAAAIPPPPRPRAGAAVPPPAAPQPGQPKPPAKKKPAEVDLGI